MLNHTSKNMNTSKKSIIILMVIYFVMVLLRASLIDSVWYKIWGDEYLYNDMARSISNTGTFKFANMYGPTGAYLYPVLLSLVFKFYNLNTILFTTRFLGTLVMTSMIFPTYLLAKKMNHTEEKAILFGVISLLIPEMQMVFFTVTEVLAYPLFMWVLYFLYRDIESTKISDTILVAVFCYLQTITKDFFVLLVVAYIAMRMYTCFKSIFIDKGKDLKWQVLKSQLLKVVVFLAVYLALYVVVPQILTYCGVMDGGITQVGEGIRLLKMHFANGVGCTVVNWISAGLVYVFYTLLTFGVLTILLPLSYRYYDDSQKNFLTFLNVLIFCIIGVIVITIQAHESPIGGEDIRIHMRYVFYFFIPYFLLMYKIDFDKINKSWIISFGVGFVIVYAVCMRYVYQIRHLFALESMSYMLLVTIKGFITDYPDTEGFFTMLLLMVFWGFYLVIKHKGWRIFCSRIFPCIIVCLFIVNTGIYIQNLKLSTKNYGNFKEGFYHMAETLNQYEQGEVILIGETKVVDSEIQTLQLMLEKSVDKISIDELDALYESGNGTINFHEYERTPFQYSTETGHVLEEAKYIGTKKSYLADKYQISNNVIFEDEYFIIYELQDGKLSMASSQ